MTVPQYSPAKTTAPRRNGTSKNQRQANACRCFSIVGNGHRPFRSTHCNLQKSPANPYHPPTPTRRACGTVHADPPSILDSSNESAPRLSNPVGAIQESPGRPPGSATAFDTHTPTPEAPASNPPRHCEAAGRGNLLLVSTAWKHSAGDCHVAWRLLAMTC